VRGVFRVYRHLTTFTSVLLNSIAEKNRPVSFAPSGAWNHPAPFSHDFTVAAACRASGAIYRQITPQLALPERANGKLLIPTMEFCRHPLHLKLDSREQGVTN
jgi:hypothetical protein